MGRRKLSLEKFPPSVIVLYSPPPDEPPTSREFEAQEHGPCGVGFHPRPGQRVHHVRGVKVSARLHPHKPLIQVLKRMMVTVAKALRSTLSTRASTASLQLLFGNHHLSLQRLSIRTVFPSARTESGMFTFNWPASSCFTSDSGVAKMESWPTLAPGIIAPRLRALGIGISDSTLPCFGEFVTGSDLKGKRASTESRFTLEPVQLLPPF